jgi:hypothetical protein
VNSLPFACTSAEKVIFIFISYLGIQLLYCLSNRRIVISEISFSMRSVRQDI